MRIDLHTIDRSQFDVKGQGELVLINPRKDKHFWEDHELWLRSVVCDHAGKILSMGFPKFMNFHEHPEKHEKALREAFNMYAGEKADGSLIVVSYLHGVPYLRTRGSLSLGDFHDPVMKVVRDKYPYILRPDGPPNTSYLFEYVAPENQIVLQYSEADLILLATVRWDDEEGTVPQIYNSPEDLENVASTHGFSTIVTKARYENIHTVMAQATNWGAEDNQEGIVVTCLTSKGPVMFKVKSQWYLMMHSLRFQMTPKKLRKLLAIESDTISNFTHLQTYLYALGYDFEVAQILQEESEAYFVDYDKALMIAFEVLQWFWKWDKTKKPSRGAFVAKYRDDMMHLDPWTFHYAMGLYDEKSVEAFPLAQAVGESVRTVQSWLDDRDTILAELLRTPKDFEISEDTDVYVYPPSPEDTNAQMDA